MFLKKKMCILFMGTTTDPHGVVICPVQTNKTSNSIPSVIKGYLDRNINISLKLNQMLLHGGRQDSEEGKRNAEKQGRYFTQESESVPRFQHFEISSFLQSFVLRPPKALPPNLEQRDIPEEKSTQPGFDSPSPLTRDLSERRFSHCTHRRGGLTTARIGASASLAAGAWPTNVISQCERKTVQLPLGWTHDLIWLKVTVIKIMTQFIRIKILSNIYQARFPSCRVVRALLFDVV